MKNWLKFFGISLAICLSVIFLARWRVVSISNEHIFDRENMGQLSDCQTVVVLGAGVRDDGSMSPILEERAITAKDLYDSGKACKIIASGYAEEVEAINTYLLENQIPQEIIDLDKDGVDTFATMKNVKEIYNPDKIIAISQDFHLPRAVYIARTLGMDASGFEAYKYYPYIMLEEYKYIIRDYLASIKAIWQVELINNFLTK
jgi:SanA protein